VLVSFVRHLHCFFLSVDFVQLESHTYPEFEASGKFQLKLEYNVRPRAPLCERKILVIQLDPSWLLQTGSHGFFFIAVYISKRTSNHCDCSFNLTSPIYCLPITRGGEAVPNSHCTESISWLSSSTVSSRPWHTCSTVRNFHKLILNYPQRKVNSPDANNGP
jgi:hypothetical protein